MEAQILNKEVSSVKNMCQKNQSREWGWLFMCVRLMGTLLVIDSCFSCCIIELIIRTGEQWKVN